MSQQVIAKIGDEEITNLPKDLYIDPQALQVFLEMFEGPLDLLLYLIRKQNLDILAIPIARITDQYITYINTMQVLNIDLAAEYLLMAAMLLEIKSRTLLPKPKIEVTAIDEGIDPRQELINRLLEYEKIKLGGQKLSELPTANRDYLWLDILINDEQPSLPSIQAVELQNAWHNLILKSLSSKQEHQIKRQELSVREHMTQIIRTLQEIKSTKFFNLFNPELGVSHVVVNFIAILELTKEGMIKLIFNGTNDITVSID